jgi:hypothetical protein
LSLSRASGYEAKSLVIASVSRLALWRPITGTGGAALTSVVELVSIWNGNEPRPEDAVEIIDKANAFLLGGEGNLASSIVDV